MVETLLESDEYHPITICASISVLKAASSSNKSIQWTETTVDTQNTICYSVFSFLTRNLLFSYNNLSSSNDIPFDLTNINYRETESLLQLFLSKRKLILESLNCHKIILLLAFFFLDMQIFSTPRTYIKLVILSQSN